MIGIKRVAVRTDNSAAADIQPQQDDRPPESPGEPPLRLGEILAAATVPDFAGLPLELWPGYRSAGRR